MQTFFTSFLANLCIHDGLQDRSPQLVSLSII